MRNNKLGIAIFVILALISYGMVKESMMWNKFLDENDCVLVSQEADEYVVAIGPEGTLYTVHTTGKSGWKCSDGKTYYR